MIWNYRLVNCPSTNGGQDWIQLKEVYYEGEVLRPMGYCDPPMLGSETVKGLKETMQMLNNALNRPVLHENEFKQGETA
jgi:hypothetical protein